jgi:cold shock CspA family protein
MRGTMLWFNEAKDRGFITTDANERVPVEGSAFAAGERPRGRCSGTEVAFRLAGEDGEQTAEDVVFVPEPTRGRARRRHTYRR